MTRKARLIVSLNVKGEGNSSGTEIAEVNQTGGSSNEKEFFLWVGKREVTLEPKEDCQNWGCKKTRKEKKKKLEWGRRFLTSRRKKKKNQSKSWKRSEKRGPKLER